MHDSLRSLILGLKEWRMVLIARWCGQVGTVEQYLEKGPGFIFLYHPALGPLWDVIAQKVRGGALKHGSELVLEVRLLHSSHPHEAGSWPVCTHLPPHPH